MLYISFFVANVTLERIVASSNIECPGDVITYICLIQSNSDALHLLWRVTLPSPGSMPISITYDDTSRLNDVDNLNSFIRTSLLALESEEYISSTLDLELQADISINLTIVDCIFSGIVNDSITVLVNSSGNYYTNFHSIV